jgi:CxxC-x17-CxxC domain-containing protein
MPFEDKTLVCRDCGAEFTFTAGEQEFYQERGLLHPPSRCPQCRAQKRGGERRAPSGERRMYPIICAECGREATVPFEPRTDRPVYCRECFDKRRRRQGD